MEGVSRLHVRGRRDALEKVVELDRPLIRIGRGVECEVRLLDAVMADVQAMLRRRDDGWWLQPVGPSGRIWRGSSAVEDSTRVDPGEPIRIGGHWLTLDPAPQATPEPIAVPAEEARPPAPAPPAAVEQPTPAPAPKPPITLTERPKIMPEPRPATPKARPQSATPAPISVGPARASVGPARASTATPIPPRAPSVAPARPPVANGIPRPSTAQPAPRPAVSPSKWTPAAPPTPAPTRERQPTVDRYLKDRTAPPARPIPSSPAPSPAENRRQVARPAAPKIDRSIPPSISVPAPGRPTRASAPIPARTSPIAPPSRPAPSPVAVPRQAPVVEAPEPAPIPIPAAPVPPAPIAFEAPPRKPERIPAAPPIPPAVVPPPIPAARHPESPAPTPAAPPIPSAVPIKRVAEGPRPAPPPLAIIPVAALPISAIDLFPEIDPYPRIEAPPIEEEVVARAAEIVAGVEASAVVAEVEAPAAEPPTVEAEEIAPTVEAEEVALATVERSPAIEFAPAVGMAEAIETASEPEAEAAVPEASGTTIPEPIAPPKPIAPPEPIAAPEASRLPEPPEDRRPKPLAGPRREAPPARTDEGCWPSAQDILRAWDRNHPKVEAKPAKPRRQAAPSAAPSEVIAPATRNWPAFPVVWGSASLAAVVLGGVGVGWAFHRAWEGGQAGIWTAELISPAAPNAPKAGLRVSGAIDESSPPSQKWWLGDSRRLGQYSTALRVAGTSDPRRIDEANAQIEATGRSTPVDSSTQWAKQIEKSQPAGLPREIAPLLWSAERWLSEKKVDEGLKAYRRALALAAGPQQGEEAPVWDSKPMGRRYYLPREEQIASVIASLGNREGLEYARWSQAIPRSSVAWLCVARLLKESGRPEAGDAIDQVIALAAASAPGAMEAREVRLAAAAEASLLGHDLKKAEEFYLLALQGPSNGATERSWWINLAEVYAVMNQESQRENALLRARGPSLSDEITARAAKAQLQLRATNPGPGTASSNDSEIRTANHILGPDNRQPATEN